MTKKEKIDIAREIGESILCAVERLPHGWSLEIAVETTGVPTTKISTSLFHEDFHAGNIEYDRFDPADVAESIYRLIEITELEAECLPR